MGIDEIDENKGKYWKDLIKEASKNIDSTFADPIGKEMKVAYPQAEIQANQKAYLNPQNWSNQKFDPNFSAALQQEAQLAALQAQQKAMQQAQMQVQAYPTSINGSTTAYANKLFTGSTDGGFYIGTTNVPKPPPAPQTMEEYYKIKDNK